MYGTYQFNVLLAFPVTVLLLVKIIEAGKKERKKERRKKSNSLYKTSTIKLSSEYNLESFISSLLKKKMTIILQNSCG